MPPTSNGHARHTPCATNRRRQQRIVDGSARDVSAAACAGRGQTRRLGTRRSTLRLRRPGWPMPRDSPAERNFGTRMPVSARDCDSVRTEFAR